MQQLQRCWACDQMSELGDLVPLNDVPVEFEEIEAFSHHIDELTALLRARLTPELFRLVWALLDAVECRAVAEQFLHEQRLTDSLAHHLPVSAHAIRAMRRHVGHEGMTL